VLIVRKLLNTVFKFGTDAPRDSPHMSLDKNFKKGAWSGSRDTVNFCALSANRLRYEIQIWHACSNGKSRHESPKLFFEKGT